MIKFKSIPDFDFELMKMIRLAKAKGESIEIVPDEDGEQFTSEEQQKIMYLNAKALRDFYEMTPEEILQETGFYLED